jgi:putative ATPase
MFFFLPQDIFLPHVENGTIILVGATTENPSFSLNNALLSRCRVIVLEKLSSENVIMILSQALKSLKAEVISTSSKKDQKKRSVGKFLI